jgi:hypothetical protein
LKAPGIREPLRLAFSKKMFLAAAVTVQTVQRRVDAACQDACRTFSSRVFHKVVESDPLSACVNQTNLLTPENF